MPGAPVPSAIDAPFPASFEPQPYDPQAGDVPPPWSPKFAPPQDAAQAPVGVPGVVVPAQGPPQSPGVPGLPPPPVDESLAGPPGLPPPPAELPNQGAAALGHLHQDPEAESQSRLFQWHAQEQDAEARGQGAAAAAYQQRLQDAAAEDQRKNAIATEAGARAEKAITDASNMKVDPGHWWSSRSTGQKIMGFIGAAIGGFLQARQQRGSNPFMDQINQEVNADIQAQVANVNNARAGAGQQMSMYEHMRAQFQSESAARYATAAGMYDAASKMTAAETSKFRSPITQEEGKLAYTQLLSARDAARRKATEEEQKGAIEFDKAAREDAVAREAIKKSQAERGKIGAETRNLGDKGKAVPVMVHGPKGSAEFMLSPEQAKVVQEAQKEQDAMDKEQSQHAGKHGAEYDTWVQKRDDFRRRQEATLGAAGVPREAIMSLGYGFQDSGLGEGNNVDLTPGDRTVVPPLVQKGVQLTPEQQASMAPEQSAVPVDPLAGIGGGYLPAPKKKTKKKAKK